MSLQVAKEKGYEEGKSTVDMSMDGGKIIHYSYYLDGYLLV
jgi:hypothetical protein